MIHINIKQDYKIVIETLKEAVEHLRTTMKSLREMSQVTAVTTSLESAVPTEQKLNSAIASLEADSIDTTENDKQLADLKTKPNLTPEEIEVRDLLVKVQANRKALADAKTSKELVDSNDLLEDDSVALVDAQKRLVAKQPNFPSVAGGTQPTGLVSDAGKAGSVQSETPLSVFGSQNQGTNPVK